MCVTQILAKRSRDTTNDKWGADSKPGQSRNEHVIDAMNRDLLSMSKQYDDRHFRENFKKVRRLTTVGILLSTVCIARGIQLCTHVDDPM